MAETYKVYLKRTVKELSEFSNSETLSWGEPLLISNDDANYLTIGGKNESDQKLSSSTKVVKLVSKTNADYNLYYADVNTELKTINLKNENGDRLLLNSNSIIFKKDESGSITKLDELPYAASSTVGGAASLLSTTTSSSDTKCYILGKPSASSSDSVVIAAPNTSSTVNSQGVYFSGNGVLHGSGYNDFAEYRSCKDGKPGDCVVEVGDGSLKKSTERLQAGASIISDTFGMVIGIESEGTPIAVAGRVLAKYTGSLENYRPGDAVCAASDGKIDIMTRAEIINYPDRIVGYVSEIPTYKKWNNIKVNDRIWIKVK